MRPSSKEIIRGISWVLDKRVAPHATEAWAASSLRSISGLLKHLAVRVELEGPLLAEDNADLRALLADALPRLAGDTPGALNDEVTATLERQWREPEAYPTIASLEEENEALNAHLERLIHVVNAREEADLFLEIVATDYGTPLDRLRRPIVVVRLLDRGQTYTTNFLGQYTDVLRPEAYGAAKQIEAWIEANYDVLQRVIAGPPG